MNRRMRFLSLTVVAVMLSVTASLWASAHLVGSTTGSVDTIWFADGTDAGGRSHLTRTDGMAVGVIEAANLVPGDAHTIWWIVFNLPHNCTAPGCGEDDIFNPDGTPNFVNIAAAGVAIGNATGNVAKADGTAEFGGRLGMNDVGGSGHQILIPAGGPLGPGVNELLNVSPHLAEFHFVVQTHGQARGGPKLLEQLAYNFANCTPTCEDIQAAVHLP